MLARKVFRNVVYNSLSALISNIVGVLVTIYVARALKPKLFGIYSLAISFAFLLLTFADLGITATLVRYVAHSYGKKDFELMRGYIRGLGRIKILLSIVVSLLLFSFSDLLAYRVFHKPLLSTPLKVVSIFLFFQSLTRFVLGIFNALNDFKANLIRAIVYETSRLIFIVLFVSMGFAVIGAIFGFVIASFLSLISLILLLLSKYRFIFGRAKSIEWRRVLRFASYLTLGSISWVAFAYVDSIMIGILLPAESVGFYRAAYSIVNAIGGLVSIPVVLFPVFVQLEGKDLRNAFNRAFKYSSIIAFPIVFSLILIRKPLILLIYGKEYLPAVSVLAVLSFLILRSALGFWGVVFNAKERPEFPVYVTFIAMFMNIVLNYFMILRWRIVGAGIATIISNVFSWITLAYISKRLFGIFFKAEHVLKPLIASSVMCLFLSKLSSSSLLDCVIAIVIGFFVYLAVLIALKGLTREDFEYIQTVIAKT